MKAIMPLVETSVCHWLWKRSRLNRPIVCFQTDEISPHDTSIPNNRMFSRGCQLLTVQAACPCTVMSMVHKQVRYVLEEIKYPGKWFTLIISYMEHPALFT